MSALCCEPLRLLLFPDQISLLSNEWFIYHFTCVRSNMARQADLFISRVLLMSYTAEYYEPIRRGRGGCHQLNNFNLHSMLSLSSIIASSTRCCRTCPPFYLKELLCFILSGQQWIYSFKKLWSENLRHT
jgi:hypothetical protein